MSRPGSTPLRSDRRLFSFLIRQNLSCPDGTVPLFARSIPSPNCCPPSPSQLLSFALLTPAYFPYPRKRTVKWSMRNHVSVCSFRLKPQQAPSVYSAGHSADFPVFFSCPNLSGSIFLVLTFASRTRWILIFLLLLLFSEAPKYSRFSPTPPFCPTGKDRLGTQN